MDGKQHLEYSPAIEHDACEWLGKCINKQIAGYEALANGIDLLNLLSIVDSDSFDIKKVWKLGGKNKEEDPNAFRWKNLNLLEESISYCWETNTGKNVFDKFKVDFIQIIKATSKEEIHKLFIVAVLTIVMLSQSNDASLDLISKMNDFEGEDAPIKLLLETLVQLYVEITGSNEHTTAEVFKTPSPYKKQRDFSNPDSYHMFEKLHKQEADLIYYKDLVMTQKQQLDDTEDKLLAMKRDLDSKTTQLEKLSFINKDFQNKANIGMLEFLELELKNKENQLASLHARLDEKQKEYVTKLEHYQHIFNEQTSRIKELEDHNFELRQKVQESKAHGGLRSEDMTKISQELEGLETELKNEKEKSRRLHEDLFKEKDRLMHLEIKSSDIERQNVDLQLRINDLESKVEEQESNISKLETFNNETDHSIRMNKIYGVLNSVKNDSLKANFEKVEELLKSWGATARITGDDIIALKRENAELKKNYKDLKQTFLASVPNPKEEELRGQKMEGGSSAVAQQLLKKVLIYEEQNNLLKMEKAQMFDSMMKSNKASLDHINILYSIAVEKCI